MMEKELFAAALGIAAPWYVDTVDFDADQQQLIIHNQLLLANRIPDNRVRTTFTLTNRFKRRHAH